MVGPGSRWPPQHLPQARELVAEALVPERWRQALGSLLASAGRGGWAQGSVPSH